MTETWRLLDLGSLDPYESIAAPETLATSIKHKLSSNTLLFHIPRRSVYITFKTHLNRVNVEYCRREGIPIVRDIEGGSGTVFMQDGDTSLFSLVTDPTIHSITMKSFMDSIVNGLQSMGLDPYILPNSNDILLDGKKVSGNGSVVFRGIPIINGTMAIDFDYDFCEKAIMPHPNLFANKEAKSHREWITTLKTQLGRKVSYNEAVSALRLGFESVLGVEFEVSNSLTEAEEQILEDLQEKYQSEEWMKRGKWSPVKDYWRPK